MSAAVEKFRNFKPAGPVAAAFLADTTSQVRFLRGPVGGGKTVTCIFDCLKRASIMPVCRDGWIHDRVTVVGSTYGQLERNLYPSWHFWLPRDGGDWTEGTWHGGGGRFATHRLKFDVVRHNERVPVNLEVIFAAIGELSLEQFMRGFEPSAWYLFEVDQLPEGIVEQAVGRLGRYPNAEMLRPADQWLGYVIGDLNAPDIDSWYYKLVEDVRPKGVSQYVQPSGLSPRAENLQNLPASYYQNLYEMNQHRKRWVRRFILNAYGPSDDGEPVYPEYSDEIHLSRQPLQPLKDRPLLIGLDQGLTRPAAVIGQRSSHGQLRVLAECVPGRMNARRFAEQLKALIAEKAPKSSIGGAWADPAGFTGADREAGELAWAELVGEEMGIEIEPAPTNEIDLRLTAVKDDLTFMIDPQTPALLLSGPDCPILRKGFASHYRYRRQRVGNQDRFADKPDKSDDSSHPHDALQYLELGDKGRYGVIAGPRKARGGRLEASGVSIVKSDYLAGW